jgi:hypothetical protein
MASEGGIITFQRRKKKASTTVAVFAVAIVVRQLPFCSLTTLALSLSQDKAATSAQLAGTENDSGSSTSSPALPVTPCSDAGNVVKPESTSFIEPTAVEEQKLAGRWRRRALTAKEKAEADKRATAAKLRAYYEEVCSMDVLQ